MPEEAIFPVLDSKRPGKTTRVLLKPVQNIVDIANCILGIYNIFN